MRYLAAAAAVVVAISGQAATTNHFLPARLVEGPPPDSPGQQIVAVAPDRLSASERQRMRVPPLRRPSHDDDPGR